MSKHKDSSIQAVVQSLEGKGKRRYVVTRPVEDLDEEMGEKDGTITFSISAWKGRREPWKKQIVLLSGVQKFQEGWRAERATPIRL